MTGTAAVMVDEQRDEAWIDAVMTIRAQLWGCMDEGRVTPEALELAQDLADALLQAVAEATDK